VGTIDTVQGFFQVMWLGNNDPFTPLFQEAKRGLYLWPHTARGEVPFAQVTTALGGCHKINFHLLRCSKVQGDLIDAG
jgi:hypothetical protein